MSDTETIEYTEATPKIVEIAKHFGIVKMGNTLEDYLIEAVENGGYETVNIWAVQGSGKSTRMLQMGHWIYKDWDTVLDSIVFKPSTFVEKLKSIPKGSRVPCILWDDLLVHYTSSTFRTDIKQYEAVDSAWAAIRTKVNVIILTDPIIDRVAKNIKDNLTFEVFMGRNQMEIIYRLFRLPSFNRVESNFFKVALEEPARFDLYKVPKDIWKQYWEMRLELTEEALERLAQTSDIEDIEGYTPVLDVALELKLSPNTISQMISRKILKGRAIGDTLYLQDDQVASLKQIYHRGEAEQHRGH